MEVRFDDFGIYHVDTEYMRHLCEDVDSQVYYSNNGRYGRKPFLGITVGIGTYTYFIPFSSSKPKHLSWNDVGKDYFLVYEIVSEEGLSRNAVRRPYRGALVEHILAVLDIKKMIPVPQGLYSKVDIDKIENPVYKVVLEKEYLFCRNIQDRILGRVREVYETQKATGKVRRFGCDFAALEKACDAYPERP